MNAAHNIDINTYQERFAGQDHLLIDVRETDEFNGGHLPGAISIPLSQIEANPQSALQQVPHDRSIVLVCAMGGRSAIAAQMMLMVGFDEVHNLVDGTMGWVLRGLPIEKP